jgi:hypothetical protein
MSGGLAIVFLIIVDNCLAKLNKCFYFYDCNKTQGFPSFTLPEMEGFFVGWL